MGQDSSKDQLQDQQSKIVSLSANFTGEISQIFTAAQQGDVKHFLASSPNNKTSLQTARDVIGRNILMAACSVDDVAAYAKKSSSERAALDAKRLEVVKLILHSALVVDINEVAPAIPPPSSSNSNEKAFDPRDHEPSDLLFF
jgi:hypothetical protein